MSNLVPQSSKFLLYVTPNGKVHVEVFFKDETVWLTQKKMAELFDVTIPNINLHLKNIFEQDELNPNSVIKDFLITASDNKKYQVIMDKSYISDFDREVQSRSVANRH